MEQYLCTLDKGKDHSKFIGQKHGLQQASISIGHTLISRSAL